MYIDDWPGGASKCCGPAHREPLGGGYREPDYTDAWKGRCLEGYVELDRRPGPP